MLVSRVLSRIPKTAIAQCRTSLIFATPKQNRSFSILSNDFYSLHGSSNKLAAWQASLLNNSTLGSAFQRRGVSSSEQEANVDSKVASSNAEVVADTEGKEETEELTSADASKESQTVKKRRGDARRTAFSDSESDSNLAEEMSFEELVKLAAEQDNLLKEKDKEIETMKDTFLRSYAEVENRMARTKREMENAKKFANQSFAKSLLDVADNLGRASAVVKESFKKLDVSTDSAGAVPLLKTLLEGVDMTDKQLAEVFKKFGIEKYDPVDEQFDPHRHNAVFQMPDGSKPPGTVAAVLKPGYMLYDRVLRPAEVGVTQAVEEDEANQTSET